MKNIISRLISALFCSDFFLAVVRYHAYRVRVFVKKMASDCDAHNKIVLDVGAQDLPYKKFFKKARYYSQDIVQNSSGTVDYVCDINKGMAEIRDGSFDYILCTQVLEHVSNPHTAFAEFNRVLKRGGRVYLTTHLCFEEHMIPYDYFRFTRYGLRYLGDSSGFKLVHIAPHGGVFHLIALIFDTLPVKLFIERESCLYYLYFSLFFVPIFLFNSVCFLLDFLDRKKEMTINYECIYEKLS